MNENISGKILIIDDNLSNLHLLVDMVSRHGHEILVARTGEEAIRITGVTQVDLILLDIMMPEMNGYDVCAYVKTSSLNSETPVIFLSALNDIESKIKAFSVGGVDYVSKPFQEDEIIARIHTHLSLAYTRRRLVATIAERERSEKLRRKSEKHLETILNSIPQLIVYLDPDLRIVYINKMGEHFFDLPHSTSINRSLADLTTQEYSARIHPYLKRALSGEHIQKDTIIEDTNGVYHSFDAQVIPDPGENNVLKGLFLVLTDITKYKKAEIAIRTLQKQMEIILNSIQSLIYIADMQTDEIIYANTECIKIFGDIIGKTYYQVFQSPNLNQCSFCTNDKLIGQDGMPSGVHTWELENTLNGRWYLCLDIAIPWIDDRLVRMEIATDITEKKMTEFALKRSNHKLNLLSNITRHDILNMLTSILGYGEILDEMDMEPDIRRILGKQMESIKRIERMISFTRDYQDMGCNNPAWQNADAVLQKATSTMDLSHIQFENHLAGLVLYADPLLEKVLYNLVENALRHGKNVTRISFSYQIQDTTIIIICEDNGIGISIENKEKIFARQFYQNSGFGLFFSKDILDINGMTITETGIEGKGARFEIAVPVGKYKIEPV